VRHRDTDVHARQGKHGSGMTHSRGVPKMGLGHDQVLRHPLALQEMEGELVACPSITLLAAC